LRQEIARVESVAGHHFRTFEAQFRGVRNVERSNVWHAYGWVVSLVVRTRSEAGHDWIKLESID
jgi:hypothetical protein